MVCKSITPIRVLQAADHTDNPGSQFSMSSSLGEDLSLPSVRRLHGEFLELLHQKQEVVEKKFREPDVGSVQAPDAALSSIRMRAW